MGAERYESGEVEEVWARKMGRVERELTLVSSLEHTREGQVARLAHQSANVAGICRNVCVACYAEGGGEGGVDCEADLLAAEPWKEKRLASISMWMIAGEGRERLTVALIVSIAVH